MNRQPIDKTALSLVSARQDDSGLHLFFAYLEQDFPAGEHIPTRMLRQAIQKEILHAVFLTDGRCIYGYALYQQPENGSFLHILHLAILVPYRSQGLGPVLMQRLKDLAPGRILLEAEDPDAAKDEATHALRAGRINFYRRCGFRVQPCFRFFHFGNPMLVLSNAPLPEGDWLSFYRRLYDRVNGVPLSRLIIKPR